MHFIKEAISCKDTVDYRLELGADPQTGFPTYIWGESVGA